MIMARILASEGDIQTQRLFDIDWRKGVIHNIRQGEVA